MCLPDALVPTHRVPQPPRWTRKAGLVVAAGVAAGGVVAVAVAVVRFVAPARRNKEPFTTSLLTSPS